MSFLKNLFGLGGSDEETPQVQESEGPAIKFGRYSDSYKKSAQTKHWDDATKAFDAKNYLDSYEHFFKYLNDPEVNNVSYTRNDNELSFELFQGSKKVTGKANNEKISAEVMVAKASKLSVAFMRKLVEMNYSQRYSRFALNDDVIYMKFNSTVIDGSPEKMYYALREISTKADKQDDLLVSEFSMLENIENSHIEDIPEAEKATKIKYLKKWINDLITRIPQLEGKQLDGGISYMILNLTYKIDYLLAPEGPLMSKLEKIHAIYFAKDNRSTTDKNADMIQQLKDILEIPDEQLKSELYQVTATFGIVNPTPHNSIAGLIENESKNMPWYQNNGYEDVATAILEYIAGYCLFYYGMHKPTKGFFEVFMNIINEDFYNELGLNTNYVENGKVNRSAIEKKINEINGQASREFPKAKFMANQLKYNSFLDFCNSYLQEIKFLNYAKQ